MRQNEQTIVYPSINKIKNYIDWKSKINIDDGLKKTINYYRKNKK